MKERRVNGIENLTLTDDGLFFQQWAEDTVEVADNIKERIDKWLVNIGLVLESIDKT